MRRRVGGNLNIGTSSLLLIFIVLSLVSFAVLSLSSALTDKRVTMSHLDRSTAYYAACNEAERSLKDMDAAYIQEYKEKGSVSVSNNELTIPVNDTQTLDIKVAVHEPDSDGSTIDVIKWKVENISVPQIDDSINLLIQ